MIRKHVTIRNASAVVRHIHDRRLSRGVLRLEPGEEFGIDSDIYMTHFRACRFWMVNVDAENANAAAQAAAEVQEPENVALKDLTRKELDAKAEELGIEGADKLANKDAVIAAIQTALAAAEVQEPEPVEEPESPEEPVEAPEEIVAGEQPEEGKTDEND